MGGLHLTLFPPRTKINLERQKTKSISLHFEVKMHYMKEATPFNTSSYIYLEKVAFWIEEVGQNGQYV